MFDAFKVALLILPLGLPVVAQENPMVGGAAMFADRTIVANAVNSKDHETLVAAVQQQRQGLATMIIAHPRPHHVPL